MPRCRLGQTTLFTVHIFPGILEVTLELDQPIRESLIGSPRLGAAFKAALHAKATTEHMRLQNQTDVRGFGKLDRRKSRTVTAHQTE